MRDKIGESYALTYLRFKGISPEKAADILSVLSSLH